MLSVALMCHPSRERFVTELAEQLPEAEVVWDHSDDRWETGARSLMAFDPAASHHMVIQDDAVLCRDLVAGAGRAARAAGDRSVALYTGRVRPQPRIYRDVLRAKRAGVPWLRARGPLWGVGLIIPTAHIPELVAWGNGNAAITNYDRRIEKFYSAQDIDCWYTVPSLVDHRCVAENPSLVEGRTGNRTACLFIGDASPLDIDWNREPLVARAR